MPEWHLPIAAAGLPQQQGKGVQSRQCLSMRDRNGVRLQQVGWQSYVLASHELLHLPLEQILGMRQPRHGQQLSPLQRPSYRQLVRSEALLEVLRTTPGLRVGSVELRQRCRQQERRIPATSFAWDRYFFPLPPELTSTMVVLYMSPIYFRLLYLFQHSA